jgi:hypothetical protein
MSALISLIRRRFAVLLAALGIGAGVGASFVVLGAHASPVGDPVVDTNPAQNVVDIPPYEFNGTPLGDVPGTVVKPGGNLPASLPLQPVLPRTAKADPTIYITDPTVQEDWQLVVLDYDTSAYGRLQIFERAQGMTQPIIDQWAEPGYCTSCAFSESVVLAGGQRATILGTPETTTAVHWIQKGVQIDVVGPYSSLGRDEAVAVANDLSVQ